MNCAVCHEFCSRRNRCLMGTFTVIGIIFGLAGAVAAILFIGKAVYLNFRPNDTGNYLLYWIAGFDTIIVFVGAIAIIIGIVFLVIFVVKECRAARARASDVVNNENDSLLEEQV